MNFLKKPWFIAIVLTIVVVIGVQYYIKAKGTEAATLSAEEIRSQIETVYDGEILAFDLRGDGFQATIAKDGAEYALEGDATNGNVLSLVQTKETTVADVPDDEEKEQVSEEEDDKQRDESPKDEEKEQPKKKTKEEKTSRITEKEAADIGLAQLPDGMVGEIDDIDFEQSDEGGYYLVEIDIDTDDDYDEVAYQIHALTGEILTTTWDD